MNVFAVISFLLAAAVFLISVLTSGDNPEALLDFHGALIVLGGTVSATAISFQLDRTLLMLKVFYNRTIRGKKPDYIAIIRELMKLAEAYRNDSPTIKQDIDKLDDHFMKEAMNALLDGIVPISQLENILKNRVQTLHNRYSDDANRFKAMGKYPPAMGLMGAVLGMIALLAGLGKPGAEKGVGPAMSIALVATFYGIALANLVIIPIGENLAETSKEVKRKNVIIVEGVRLISQKTNPIVLAEELNSFLLPAERIDWKSIK